MRIKRIACLFVLLFVQHSYAQNVLRFQHISIEDGLSQSSVNRIFQDTHGFIWFATGDGLNRYDGKQFIAYKSHLNDTTTGSIHHRNINSHILEDRYNRVWFSSDAGLSYLNTHTGKFTIVFDKYQMSSAGVFKGIDDETFWACRMQQGIFSINVKTLKSTLYPFSDSFQMSKEVTVITSGIGTKNGLWITDKAGLIYFDKETKKDHRKIIKNDLNSVSVLRNGNLLLGTTNGVWLYHPPSGSLEFVEIRDNNKDIVWKTIVEDTISGTIYLGSLFGGTVCKLDISSRRYELLNVQNSRITDLFIDRSHNLWIGTDGNGVYKLDIKQPKFFCFGPKKLYEETEQSSLFVKSIYRGDSGKIWMGVYNNGLFLYDPANGKQEKMQIAPSYDNQLIGTIIKDSSGRIVTTSGNTILWLDEQSQRILKKTELPPHPSIPSMKPYIYAMVEWKKGHYLVATDFGMYKVIAEQVTARILLPSVQLKDSLASGWQYNIYKSDDGSIYIGLRAGFSKIRMLSDTQVQVLDHGLRDIPIRHFYKSRNHPILWIASEQGLIAYNEQTKHYTVFDERAGLANSFVYAILDENDSSLWVSTNKGLSNAKVHYAPEGNVTASFNNFTVKDGLQSSEFNTGAYFKAHDGTLFFGGIAGINWFNPGQIKKNSVVAKPAIAAIFINDSLYAGDTAIYVQRLFLPHNRNTISLTLSALEFTTTGRNSFAYKLEGMDKDWVYTANDQVRYSNLLPGTYEFQLRASNNDGIWNDDPLKLLIIIQPPYWQTWWFRSLIGLSLLALIYLTVRYYIKQKVQAKTRDLEQQKALYSERLRISKDVHDDLGSGLSKISLMAAIAQKKVNGNDRLHSDIKQISFVSKELVDNMRDLVWVLNPENTSLEQLVSRLREYCADYLENMPLQHSLDFPDHVPPMRISRESQRNIFLTVKEAINNSIKHSDASDLKISLALEDDKMTIVISDNGRGFDMAHLKGSGNGLRNMRQRIESIGGSFSITSLANEHTTIAITITFERLCAEKIPL